MAPHWHVTDNEANEQVLEQTGTFGTRNQEQAPKKKAPKGALVESSLNANDQCTTSSLSLAPFL